MNIFSCRAASELVSNSLDRKLTWGERITLQLHLMICSLCTRFQKQLRILRDVTNHIHRNSAKSELPIEARLSPETRDRIKRALGQQ